VEARFEVENTKTMDIVVELEVTMLLGSGKESAKQKLHKPTVVKPGQVKRLGLWQAPGALETTWKWREAEEEVKPIIQELEGVFLSRIIKPPSPADPKQPAEIHFETWTTNAFAVVVEIDITGEEIIRGHFLRGKLKGKVNLNDTSSKVVKVGVVQAHGEVDVQWSWRGFRPE
jgi:hypothetical protein